MKRRLDNIVTYVLAAVLTVMFCFATIVYWPPWQRLQRFSISFDNTVALSLGAGAPDDIQIAKRP